MVFFNTGPQLHLAAEYPPADEQHHVDSLIRELRAKMQRDYAKTRTLRDAHPKMHGCVRGDFSIVPDLPGELSIGVFKRSRTFPVWVRFSNQNGTVSTDAKADIRGVAIKLMGVEGARLLPDGAPGTTQDFILISDSRFVTKNVAEFDGLAKALIAGRIPIAWYFLTHLRVLRNLISSLGCHTHDSFTDIRYARTARVRRQPVVQPMALLARAPPFRRHQSCPSAGVSGPVNIPSRDQPSSPR